ncbi:MAG TPA: RluA family pseudouridine synthase [Bryobacteraceae bacterium]|nr:RluA family pseudouridine synthase [Bryobacteraceae bacterium]
MPTFSASAADAGKRLDVFLQERLSEFSRSRVQAWIRDGRARVNGSAEKASYHLRGDETVEVNPAQLPALRATAEDLPLAILYEDADVIAVDKPAGMVVHAGAGVHSGTLVNALLHHFEALSGIGGDLRPGIVHRIDRFTSGVLLVARHDAAHRKLADQFSGRTMEKVYLALVHGRVKAETGRIEKPITRDPGRRIRMTARLGAGRAAITEYKVLRRFERFTFLEVRILTGRTHQIRVHFASIGHPVAGDSLYGAAAHPGADRFFLHAHRIRFLQPTTGEAVTVVSPLPPELQQWMKEL